jgi:NitT/TauT family transport system substrate-binding protein
MGQGRHLYGFCSRPARAAAKSIEHVILDTAQNRPWPQYFCCLLTANRRFVRRYPVATKRSQMARSQPPKTRYASTHCYEMGMIKSKPQELVATGTDWRVLDELSKELKV